MALNTSKCNHLPPLPFKGLNDVSYHWCVSPCGSLGGCLVQMYVHNVPSICNPWVMTADWPLSYALHMIHILANRVELERAVMTVACYLIRAICACFNEISYNLISIVERRFRKTAFEILQKIYESMKTSNAEISPRVSVSCFHNDKNLTSKI